MTCEELRNYAREKMCGFRNLERIVNSFDFEDACAVATDEQLLEIEGYIKMPSPDRVKEWVKKINKTDWHEYTIPQLRIIAKRQNIKYYGLLNKVDLIEAIEHKMREKND